MNFVAQMAEVVLFICAIMYGLGAAFNNEPDAAQAGAQMCIALCVLACTAKYLLAAG